MDYEYKIDVAGVEYFQENGSLISGAMHQSMFDKFGIGNACVSYLTVSFYPSEEPPRMAPITVFARAIGDVEWTKLCKFYTDTRNSEILEGGRVLTLTAYDAMLKADQIYIANDDESDWPKTMPDVASEIASRMEVELDPRTVLNASYFVDYPNDYTMREILCHIAAAHAGNWIITREEKLLLIPVFSPVPVGGDSILATENEESIIFGGNVSILV